MPLLSNTYRSLNDLKTTFDKGYQLQQHLYSVDVALIEHMSGFYNLRVVEKQSGDWTKCISKTISGHQRNVNWPLWTTFNISYIVTNSQQCQHNCGLLSCPSFKMRLVDKHVSGMQQKTVLQSCFFQCCNDRKKYAMSLLWGHYFSGPSIYRQTFSSVCSCWNLHVNAQWLAGV